MLSDFSSHSRNTEAITIPGKPMKKLKCVQWRVSSVCLQNIEHGA